MTLPQLLGLLAAISGALNIAVTDGFLASGAGMPLPRAS